MQNNNVMQLLSEVETIVARNRIGDFSQGKEFNVFCIQKTADDEVRVCRLIRELLDPKGSHGQESFFLRSFMENVLKDGGFTDEDYRHASIVQEERIDFARRIDLVIRIKNRVFPIEMKIYAEDQPEQCQDYYHYAARIDRDTKLYYLTLDGREPPHISKGNLTRRQYECISFSSDILGWMKKSIDAQELKHAAPVREILIQFGNALMELTGKARVNTMKEVKEAIESTNENMIAAANIVKAMPYVKADLMIKVFEQIKSHMNSRGFYMSKDSYRTECEAYCVSRRRTWPKVEYILDVSDKALEGEIAMCFQMGDRLYFGIRWIREKTAESEDYVRTHLMPSNITIREDGEHYYWWRYLPEGSSPDFWQENEEYFKLFDHNRFDDYMNEIYSITDLALDSILKG